VEDDIFNKIAGSARIDLRTFFPKMKSSQLDSIQLGGVSFKYEVLQGYTSDLAIG
jgi:hypothetical protein